MCWPSMTGLLTEPAEMGSAFNDIRCCPLHPEAVAAENCRLSDWRKPAPGVILDLLACWPIDRASGFLIGDQRSDCDAAVAAGISSHLFRGGNLADLVSDLLAAGRLPSRD
jgi:D-glycero-D-manno-heptose 1,7-bisphosphate phosphatase